MKSPKEEIYYSLHVKRYFIENEEKRFLSDEEVLYYRELDCLMHWIKADPKLAKKDLTHLVIDEKKANEFIKLCEKALKETTIKDMSRHFPIYKEGSIYEYERVYIERALTLMSMYQSYQSNIKDKELNDIYLKII